MHAKRRARAFRTNVVGRRIAINEHGRGTEAMHAARRCEESEGRADDRIARFDTECLQREKNRIGTVRAANRVLGVAVGGSERFKLSDLRAAHKVLTLDDFLDHGLDFRADGRVLRFEVEQRNGYSRGGRGQHIKLLMVLWATRDSSYCADFKMSRERR